MQPLACWLALAASAPGDAARTIGRDVGGQLGSNLGKGFELLAVIAAAILVVVGVALAFTLRALVRLWRARGRSQP
ncbi:MAG: hypothetical protein R3A79_16405 [Nannocystaceae bacterium]